MVERSTVFFYGIISKAPLNPEDATEKLILIEEVMEDLGMDMEDFKVAQVMTSKGASVCLYLASSLKRSDKKLIDVTAKKLPENVAEIERIGDQIGLKPDWHLFRM